MMRKHYAIFILLFWLLFFQEGGKEWYIPIEFSRTDCLELRKQYTKLLPHQFQMCIEMPFRSAENDGGGENELREKLILIKETINKSLNE